MDEDEDQESIIEVQGRWQAIRILVIAYRAGIITRQELVQALVDLMLQI